LIVYAVCLAEIGRSELAENEIEGISLEFPSYLTEVAYLPLIRMHRVCDSRNTLTSGEIEGPSREIRKMFHERELLNNVQHLFLAYSLCRIVELLQEHFPDDTSNHQFADWARRSAVVCIGNSGFEKNTPATRKIFRDKRIAILLQLPELKRLEQELNPGF